MTTLEERVPRLEGIIEQINERLRGLEQGQESLRQGQESLRQEIRAIYREMENNFRWTVGVVLVTWITVIGTVLGALLTR